LSYCSETVRFTVFFYNYENDRELILLSRLVKPISHKTRFPYGILGYTPVHWYECWAPTVPWYELDLNVAWLCTNKARIYLVRQGLSWFERDLHTILIRLFNGSKYGLVRLNTIFTRFTWHSQGLHTVPPTCVRVMLEFTYLCMFDINCRAVSIYR